MTLVPPDQRETGCYTWHGTTAVTLTWDASLSWACGPGLSVSRSEPLGEILSCFCLSSSRALGRGLLLGQRSQTHFFADLIGALLHQDYSNAHAEFAGYGDNSHSRGEMAGMGVTDGAIEFAQLPVLTDRRPRRLDEFAAQPRIAAVGNRAPHGFLARRMLGRDHAQKACQLTDIFQLAPIPDTRQQLRPHNPANATDAHQIVETLRQLGLGLAKPANLAGGFDHLFFGKLHTVQQLIEFEPHRQCTGQLAQLLFDTPRPLTARGGRRKLQPFHQQQRFDPLLHPYQFTDKGIAQLG